MKFTCSNCLKEFDADPDCVLENHIDMAHEAEPGEEWKHEGHKAELSPEDRERAKAEMELTDDELDRLLAGETVVSGGIIVCKPCQDQMHEEQYGYRP